MHFDFETVLDFDNTNDDVEDEKCEEHNEKNVPGAMVGVAVEEDGVLSLQRGVAHRQV